MKKKFVAFLSIFLISFSLISCSSDKNTNDTTTNNSSTSTTTESEPAPPSSNENSDATKEEDKTKEEQNKNTTKEIASRIYFYNGVDDVYSYVDTVLTVENGAYVTALANELKNTNYSDNLLNLPKKITVTSAKLDSEKGILSVYFNEDFGKYMNLGSSSEIGIITSLVNTFGYNYKVDKVAIYCNGKPYSGQFGETPEGYFTVSYDDCKPL